MLFINLFHYAMFNLIALKCLDNILLILLDWNEIKIGITFIFNKQFLLLWFKNLEFGTVKIYSNLIISQQIKWEISVLMKTEIKYNKYQRKHLENPPYKSILVYFSSYKDQSETDRVSDIK